jgi:ABC-type uncharacterized transport system YnjBCD permease subunit
MVGYHVVEQLTTWLRLQSGGSAACNNCCTAAQPLQATYSAAAAQPLITFDPCAEHVPMPDCFTTEANLQGCMDGYHPLVAGGLALWHCNRDAAKH